MKGQPGRQRMLAWMSAHTQLVSMHGSEDVACNMHMDKHAEASERSKAKSNRKQKNEHRKSKRTNAMGNWRLWNLGSLPYPGSFACAGSLACAGMDTIVAGGNSTSSCDRV